MRLNVLILCICLKRVLPLPTFKKFALGPRIINGDVAQKDQFPWQAALNITEKNGHRNWCGGALISNKWILTAGHCVKDASYFEIMLGSNSLEGEDENRIRLNSSIYILHEQYNPQDLNNDIALISLPEAINFNDHVKPIPLYSKSLYPGTTVTVSGWGLTSDSSETVSPVLNYASLSLIPDDVCSEAYKQVINDGVICAEGGVAGQSTCEGDSGGPLVVNIESETFHVGVVSFGHPDGCESKQPVAFTRTDYYREWIKDKTDI